MSNSQIARALNPVTVNFNIVNSKSSINPIAPEFTVQFGGDLPPNKYTNYTVPYANFTIKNPQFPPHTRDGQEISYAYYLRWKEHSGTSWVHYSIPVSASDSNYTVYALTLVCGEAPDDPHVSGQADFQVAVRATSVTAESVFVSQLSNWSDTQTITLAADSNYSSPTPSVPELPMAFLPLILGITMVTMTALLKKNHKSITN